MVAYPNLMLPSSFSRLPVSLQHHQELSILDYEMLKYDYSTIAAAGLLAGHNLVGSNFGLQDLLELAPCLNKVLVSSCALAIEKLHSDRSAGQEC